MESSCTMKTGTSDEKQPDVCILCCHLRLGLAATQGHVSVHPCHTQGLCLCPYPMLPSKAMWTSMVWNVTGAMLMPKGFAELALPLTSHCLVAPVVMVTWL